VSKVCQSCEHKRSDVCDNCVSYESFSPAPCRCRELRRLLERVLDEGWSSLPLAADIRKELEAK
jgi:hypothetical protein